LASSPESPSVSVIIPVRNEARFIEQNIRSVLANDYPADRMEIVVVDGMSEDDTGRIVQKIAAEDSRVRYVFNPARITPAAFNIGVRASKGEVVFIVSGHAMVTPSFIRLSVQALREHPDAWCAGGHIETVADNRRGQCISAAMSSPIGVGDARFRLGSYKGYVGTVAFGAYWRCVFDAIGYFDEQLLRNQDDDFNQRIVLAGGKIYLDSDIVSSYYSRGSFNALARQYYQYGFWRIRTLQKHRRPMKLRQIVPLLFVSTLLVALVSAFFWQPLRYYLAGLGVLYALVLLAGGVDVARRRGVAQAVLAPVVFMILHFGYGIGNLAGIWRFILCADGGISSLARSLPAAVIVAAASLTAVAALDFTLDPRVSVNFFYFIPLALSVILLGRGAGIVCAVLAGIESVVDHSMAPVHSSMTIMVWDGLMRTCALLVACILLDIWWRRRAPATAANAASQPSLAVLLLRAILMPPDPADLATAGQKIKQFLTSLALVYLPLAAISCVGFAVGPRVSLAPFYALPIIVAVLRHRGVLGGMICAFCAGGIFLAIHLLGGDEWHKALWNSAMRLAILLTIAILAWGALIKAHSDTEQTGQA
jgi:glycosyltransferase involved in cell wall biosynthesis